MLVLDSHAEGGEGCGPAQAAVFKEKGGDFVRICRGLQDDGAELTQGSDELGGEGADGFDALDLCVKGGGGFEGELSRGLVALGAESDKTALAARGEKASTAADSSA